MIDQVSKFTHVVMNETGHNTNIKIGALLQLKQIGASFKKNILLMAIFKKVDIQNKEYVAIQFNKLNNAILSHLKLVLLVIQKPVI